YDIIRGIGRASSAEGYTMAVADSMEDTRAESTLVADMLQQADAMVLVAPREDPELLEELRRAPKPVLMLLGPRTRTSLPDRSVDNLGGMSALYAHLAELGHLRVVYLAGPAGAWQYARRVEAAR